MILSPVWMAVTLLVISVTAQQLLEGDATHPEGLVEMDLDNQVARFPWVHPSVKLHPKTSNGNAGEMVVSEPHYATIAFLGLRELGNCTCCKVSYVGGQLLDCDDTNSTTERLDLRSLPWQRTVALDEQGKPLRLIFLAEEDELKGTPRIKMEWESLRANQTRAISNGQKDRTLALKANNLKFSLEISNYTSVFDSGNNFHREGRFWALGVYLLIATSEELKYVDKGLGTFTPAPDFKPSPWQYSVYIRSIHQPYLQFNLVQSMFSVAEPPSLSTLLHPNDTSEHGFENAESRQQGPYYEDGVVKGELLETRFPSGNYLFYDPEFGVLLEQVEPEEGKDEEEDDEWITIVAAVLSSLCFVGVMAVIAVAVWHWRKGAKKNMSVASAEGVNF
ncbi:hypothetical protein QOT17_013422 [Balamuthia mandrillaris]